MNKVEFEHATFNGSEPVRMDYAVSLLTDNEIRKVADKADEGQESTEFMLAFARAIEALVRQKAGLK